MPILPTGIICILWHYGQANPSSRPFFFPQCNWTSLLFPSSHEAFDPGPRTAISGERATLMNSMSEEKNTKRIRATSIPSDPFRRGVVGVYAAGVPCTWVVSLYWSPSPKTRSPQGLTMGGQGAPPPSLDRYLSGRLRIALPCTVKSTIIVLSSNRSQQNIITSKQRPATNTDPVCPLSSLVLPCSSIKYSAGLAHNLSPILTSFQVNTAQLEIVFFQRDPLRWISSLITFCWRRSLSKPLRPLWVWTILYFISVLSE